MTNDEFKKLMAMQKRINSGRIELPRIGEKGRIIDVVSNTSKDVFVIDLDRRSTISLSKVKLQERHMNSLIGMVRLEIDARPHINPDGRKLSRNHIHIYSEGYGTSVAFELNEMSKELFRDIGDYNKVFNDFCEFCKISLDGITIQGVM